MKRIDLQAINAPIENGGEYFIEDGDIARSFAGTYTIAEVQAVLADMLAVRRVCASRTLVPTASADTAATTKAHALTILRTFRSQAKVADLYDDSAALRDALAFVFGADFEFPNVSHLTIAQVIARLAR